ncbi:MAG: Aminopeptidase 2 mitochondrial [Alyxoria varia]|nr:MAG: Aminopeptidase 2 mitochondrial [Alyxoria varia]
MYRDGDVTAVPDGREVLPDNVKPTHYEVLLNPDLEKFTYSGLVRIDLDVKEDSSSITLNTLELSIDNASLTVGSKPAEEDKISSLQSTQDEEAQTTTFALTKTVPKGSKARLTIEFKGTLNNQMAGFYRSSYTGEDGSKKYMATTQMEATDARRAIPCFDEPALKATFQVTLTADEHLTCLSNMDVKEQKPVGNGKKSVTFNTTPPMSTYLLAFIVSELKCVESNDFRVPVRVFAPPDQDIERGRFSVDLAAKTLKFYEDKFDSKFPLPKMDMVAIPDFSAGAMENWGLVTYRLVDLLFDEKTSGAGMKLRVAEVVQHELAHQWFGNLVTMDFWEGLWLNEGFATWMSWYSCNAFFPEWKVWQSYVTDSLASALSLDSLRSSHPVEVPVKKADDINQIFDAISYEKGSCVLRMISKYLGEETFLKGIRIYLKRHAYGNTKTTDLWNALSEASGEDVAKVMEVWTKYVGYPVVSVSEDEKSNKVHVKQNRFLRTHDVTPEEDKTLYPVFLALRTSEGVDESKTLFDREGSFDIPKDDFYKLNADHSSTYRTFYTASRLHKLGEAAKKGLLTVEDRAGMIADAGALSASAYQPSSSTLTLLKGFSSESDYVVWDQLTTWLANLRATWIFEEEATRDALGAFLRDIASPKAHSLGWTFTEKDDSITQQFKALMFASLGVSGDGKVVAAAKDMFEKFSNGDRGAINPNLRGAVYSIILKNGGGKEYDIILDEFRTAKTSDERNTALRSLGRAKQPELIQRTLAMALGDEVRSQDIYMPLGALRTHPDGIRALWKFMKENWDALVERLPPSMSLLSSVVSICTSGFTHKDQKADVERFFEGKSTKGFDKTLAQSLEAVNAKSDWVARDRKDVESWLKENKYL